MRIPNIPKFSRLDIISLVAVTLIGLVHLAYPFDGDQALFTIGSMKMDWGGILYRDFWDLKQPGIYFFYFIAGNLFGFNEVGIHTFELLYMLALSVVLIVTLKSYYQQSALASVVPILTVGVYYSISGYWHLTQLEAVVGFPIFLALWFTSSTSQSGKPPVWRLFLSGLMGGIVLLFKLIFLPILISFWLTFLINFILNEPKQLPKALIRIFIPISLGLLLPLLIVCAYFAWFDTLNIVYKTFFEYPPLIVTQTSVASINRLIGGLKWFAYNFAAMITLSLIGSYFSLRQHRDLITINCILWLFVGLGVIFLQRQSWWQYHYLLLFVPLGILAVKGLDVLREQFKDNLPFLVSKKGYISASLSLTLLFLPVLISITRKSVTFAGQGLALQKQQQLKYQIKINGNYQRILTDVEFLSQPESLPSDIYVCGNPLYYFLSGRNQAISLNGWALEFMLPTQWPELIDQLNKAFPPYIFIESYYVRLIPNQSPKMMNFITKNYRVLRSSKHGVWYVLRTNSPQQKSIKGS